MPAEAIPDAERRSGTSGLPNEHSGDFELLAAGCAEDDFLDFSFHNVGTIAQTRRFRQENILLRGEKKNARLASSPVRYERVGI